MLLYVMNVWLYEWFVRPGAGVNKHSNITTNDVTNIPYNHNTHYKQKIYRETYI
jgi:hypothetical protein